VVRKRRRHCDAGAVYDDFIWQKGVVGDDRDLELRVAKRSDDTAVGTRMFS